MSNALETQGVTLKIGDGASPEVFTAISEIIDFTGPGGQAAVIDVTSLDSTAREKRMGLPDEGQFTFNGILLPDDTGQSALRTARTGRTLKNFKLTLTDSPATTLSFSAYVLGFENSGGVDDVLRLSVTLEITGPVTWS